MTETELIGLPPEQDITNPATQWTHAAFDLFGLVKHANDLIEETETAIWEKPAGDKPEVPGRAVIGSHSDPTGDTTTDPRRIHLNHAITNLIYDPQRIALWADLITTTNQLTPTPQPNTQQQPGHYAQFWLNPRNQILTHLRHTTTHLTHLATHHPKPLTKLARQTHHANLHTKQRIRRAEFQLHHYQGATTQ